MSMVLSQRFIAQNPLACTVTYQHTICTQVSRTVAQVARHISHTPQGTSRTSLLACQPSLPLRKQPRDSTQEVAHVRSRAEKAGQADSQNGKDRGAMHGMGGVHFLPIFTCIGLLGAIRGTSGHGDANHEPQSLHPIQRRPAHVGDADATVLSGPGQD